MEKQKIITKSLALMIDSQRLAYERILKVMHVLLLLFLAQADQKKGQQ